MKSDFGDRIRPLNHSEFSWSGFVFGAHRSSRIDYLFLPRADVPLTSRTIFTACPLSDHKALTTSFDPSGIPRGPGSWSFNVALLNDDRFRTTLQRIVQRSRQDLSWKDNIFQWYDDLKRSIKAFSIFYSKNRASEKRHSRATLIKRISELETSSDHSADTQNSLSTLRADLRSLDYDTLRGEIVRSRATHYEDSDRPTKYFLRLESYRQRCKSMSVLRSASGITITDAFSIRTEAFNYYSRLYTRGDTITDTSATFAHLVRGRLSAAARDDCESHLTWAELVSALKLMQKNKSPGTDGLPAELWLFLLPVIKAEFLRIIQRIVDTGTLPKSMSEGMIVLLPKKGDLTDLGNWRPITLLNTDYKCIAKALAARLSSILPDIISPTQTGAIRKRDVSRTPRYLTDMAELLKARRESGIILQVDLTKAFDQVDWHYLFLVLEAMGFGPVYRTLVQTLLTGSRACLKINGFMTEFFKLGRSVRQGCPLSPLLYVISAEPLCRALELTSTIPRIPLPDGTLSPMLFTHMDDNTILTRTVEGVAGVIAVYEDFGRASGAVLNISKCHGSWLGDLYGHADKAIGGIRISSAPVKILGAYIGYTVADLNWGERLSKFKRILRTWKGRPLTLLGKVLVVNILASSTIYHLLNAITLPPEWASAFRSAALDFVWNGGPHHTSYSTLVRPRRQGGFGLVDPDLKGFSFRLKEIQSLIQGASTPYEKSVATALQSLSTSGLDYGLDVFRLALNAGYSVGLPPRQKLLIRVWKEAVAINGWKFPELSTIMNEPLFFNPRVHSHLFSSQERKIFAKGQLLRVKDLCYEFVPGFLPYDAVLEQLEPFTPGLTPSRALTLLTDLRQRLPVAWVHHITHRQGIYQNRHSTAVTPCLFPVETGDGDRPQLHKAQKAIYHDLALTRHGTESAGEERWRSYFGGPLRAINWKSLSSNFLGPRLSANNLKVVHHAFPLLNRLAHAGVVPTATCLLCDQHDEDLEHLLLNCPTSHPWWHWLLVGVLQLPISRFADKSPERDLLIIYDAHPGILGKTAAYWKAASFLIATLKLAIWLTRCFVSFSDQTRNLYLDARVKAIVRREVREKTSRLSELSPLTIALKPLFEKVFTV